MRRIRALKTRSAGDSRAAPGDGAGSALPVAAHAHGTTSVPTCELAFDALPDLVAILDADRRAIRVNAALAARLGVPPDKCVGRSCHALLHGEEPAPPGCPIAGELARSMVYHRETYCEALGGWFDVRLAPISQGGDSAAAAVLVACDITERRQVEEARRASEERYRSLLDASPDAIFLSDLNAVPQWVNPRGATLLGFESSAELLARGGTLFDFVTGPDRARAIADKDRLLSGGRVGNIEYPIVRRDGTTFIADVNAAVIRGEDGRAQAFTIVIRDVTRRQLTEQALRASEANYREIFDASPHAIFVHDSENGGIVDVNATMCAMFGVTRSEARHGGLDLLSFSEPPFTLEEAVARVRRAVREGPQVFDWVARRQNGELFWVEVCLKRARLAGYERVLAFVRDITQRKQAEAELHRYRSRLEELVEQRAAELHTAYESLQRETADRKRVEEQVEEQRTQLAHAARLSALGEMAARLAHELNQPLGAISNYASVCRALADERGPDELGATLDKIVVQAERAGEIIRRTRRFVRAPQPHRTLADINQLVRETVGLLESEARRKGVEIVLDLSKRVPRLNVDVVQLQQVVVNLLQNGLDVLQHNPGTDRRLTVYSDVAADGRVNLAVRDTGPGFGELAAERVFEPFFTTKRDGMGLGLAISRSLVEAHGGRLWASAAPEGGAIFHISLPSVREGD